MLRGVLRGVAPGSVTDTQYAGTCEETVFLPASPVGPRQHRKESSPPQSLAPLGQPSPPGTLPLVTAGDREVLSSVCLLRL